MIKTIIFILSFVLITNYANALTAEWQLNPVEDQVIDYTLYYGPQGATSKTVKSATNGVSIGDTFEPGITYVFMLAANNLFGEGVKSDPVIYVIPANPPEDNLEPDAPSGIKILLVPPDISGSTP